MKLAKRRQITRITCIVLAALMALSVMGTLIGAFVSDSRAPASGSLPRLVYHGETLYMVKGGPVPELPEKEASSFTAESRDRDQIPNEDGTANFTGSLEFSVLTDGRVYWNSEDGFVPCIAVTVKEVEE